MKTCADDRDLMDAVACHRDREAFKALFMRHQSRMYNLAYRLIRNHDHAQEAVQEAMLRIWTMASSFRAEGEPLKWILSIVVRECFKLLRTRKRQRTRIERKRNRENADPFCRPVEEPPRKVENEELVHSLYRCIDRLEPVDRKILTLYFDAEMTQAQIGRSLSLAQTTVSFKLQDALKRLRKDLKRFGHAPAAICVTALREASHMGLKLPDSILADVMDLLGSAKDFKSLTAANLSSQSSFSMASISLTLGGFTFVGLVGSGVVVLNGLPATTPSTIALSAMQAQEVVPELVETQKVELESNPLNRVWTFEKGPIKGFRNYKADWLGWRGAIGVRPAVMIAGPNMVFCKIPIQFTDRPMLVRIDTNARISKEFVERGSGCLYVDDVGSLLFEGWSKEMTGRDATQFRHDIYFAGHHMFNFLNGELINFKKHRKSFPSSQVGLYAKEVAIKRIEVRGISLDELPMEIRDPDKLLAQVMQSPAWAQDSISFGAPDALGINNSDIRSQNSEPGSLKENSNMPITQLPYRSWNFKNGLMEDLKTVRGPWDFWRPEKPGVPAAIVAGHNIVSMVLPVKITARPFRIRVTVDLVKGVIVNRFFAKGSSGLMSLRFWRRLVQVEGSAKHQIGYYDAYRVGLYVINCINGIPLSVQKYSDPFSAPSSVIGFDAQKIAVRRVEFAEVRLDEIPEPFRDPAAFVKEVEKNSSWNEHKAGDSRNKKSTDPIDDF